MIRTVGVSMAVLFAFQLPGAGASADAPVANWPSWRGPDGSGVVERANPPIRWSETENVKWKTALPGEGQSTPIIWGNRIFLQTAVPVGVDTGEVKSAFGGPPSKDVTVPYKFIVLCLDRETGGILWERTVCEERPHEGFHPSGSLAPYSPVTDGRHLWASFGSRGLYCLTVDGELKWTAKTITMRKAGRYGEGSSPALVGNAVIVLADHEGQSKIFAFDKDSGDVLWEQERDEQSSWSTPTIAKVGDRYEVITSAPNYIRSYDAETGELIWKSSGLTDCAAPSPVVSNGLVFCTTGFRGNATIAIELGHTGDLTDTDAVRWMVRRGASNVPTPLVHKGRVYVFQGYRGILSCFDAETGEPVFERQRVDGLKTVYASPIAVDDLIFMCDRSGTTTIIKSSDEYEVVAINKLDEVLDASPVVVGNELYLRGRSHVYCIARSAP